MLWLERVAREWFEQRYNTPRSCGNCGNTLRADGTCQNCDTRRDY
jgi:hypothetical protein